MEKLKFHIPTWFMGENNSFSIPQTIIIFASGTMGFTNSCIKLQQNTRPKENHHCHWILDTLLFAFGFLFLSIFCCVCWSILLKIHTYHIFVSIFCSHSLSQRSSVPCNPFKDVQRTIFERPKKALNTFSTAKTLEIFAICSRSRLYLIYPNARIAKQKSQ